MLAAAVAAFEMPLELLGRVGRQVAIDVLVKAGIRSILNYAPLSPQVPDGVTVRGIDPVLSLQSMTYYIR